MARRDATDRRFPEPVHRRARASRRRSTSSRRARRPAAQPVRRRGRAARAPSRRAAQGAAARRRHGVRPRRCADDQRVFVDALGYRKGKDVELRQMAKFLAEKAKQTGVDQQLGPLNPYERRIVHLAVAEVPGVDDREHRRRVLEDRPHLLAQVVAEPSPSDVASAATRVTTALPCFPPTDTIVAIATPPGRGGIGVVRLSGADAPRRSRERLTRHARTRARAAARDVRRPSSSTQRRRDRAIDQAIVTYFPAPPRTPATTSSRSARTAARSCCRRSCRRRSPAARGSPSRASSRCARS